MQLRLVMAFFLCTPFTVWADIMCAGKTITQQQMAAQVGQVLDRRCSTYKTEPCEKNDPKTACPFFSETWKEVKAILPSAIDYKVFDVRKGGLCTKSWEVHIEASCKGSTKLLKPNLVIVCSRAELKKVVCVKK